MSEAGSRIISISSLFSLTSVADFFVVCPVSYFSSILVLFCSDFLCSLLVSSHLFFLSDPLRRCAGGRSFLSLLVKFDNFLLDFSHPLFASLEWKGFFFCFQYCFVLFLCNFAFVSFSSFSSVFCLCFRFSPCPIRSLFPFSFHRLSRIGEGTYGEVCSFFRSVLLNSFLSRRRAGFSVRPFTQ